MLPERRLERSTVDPTLCLVTSRSLPPSRFTLTLSLTLWYQRCSRPKLRFRGLWWHRLCVLCVSAETVPTVTDWPDFETLRQLADTTETRDRLDTPPLRPLALSHCHWLSDVEFEFDLEVLLTYQPRPATRAIRSARNGRRQFDTLFRQCLPGWLARWAMEAASQRPTCSAQAVDPVIAASEPCGPSELV